MKRKIVFGSYFYLIAMVLFDVLFSCLAIAETVECDNEPTDTEQVRIYFVNGMLNDQYKAEKNKNFLENKVGVNSTRRFGISLNTSRWVVFDLFQTFSQKGHEPSSFWGMLNNIPFAPQWFKDHYAASVISLGNINYSEDGDLRQMVKEYLQDLNSGKKVVLVSHSQGNFYANHAYQYIYNNYPLFRNSIGIVSVATPTARVQDGSPYTTNSEDCIINIFRFVSTILEPTGTYGTTDGCGHSFIQTYRLIPRA